MKKIISSLLSILSSSLLVIVICLLTISQTVLNKEYIKTTFNKNKYQDKVYQSVTQEINKYIQQLHIGEEDISLDKIITKKMVNSDINSLLDTIYNNKKLKTSGKEIKKNLDIVINAELNKYNRIPTKEEEKSLEEIKNNIIKDYKIRVIFSEKYINESQKYYQKIVKITKLSLKVLIPINIISIISLILINRKDTIKWLAVTLITSAIILIAIKYLIIPKFSHILILTENISEIMIIIIKEIMNKISLIGIILGIVSIITLIIKVEE